MKIQTATRAGVMPDKDKLAEDAFIRGKAMSYPMTGFWLPDPDPILRRQGIDLQVYREMMNDAHIKSVFTSRYSGTLSCEWSIEAADASEGGNKAATLCADALEALNMQQVIEQALAAIAYGFVPLAVVWEERDGQWVPAIVEGRNQDWFRFGEDGTLRFLAKNSGLMGEPVEDYRVLLVQNGATYDNPYGERTLSACFWPKVFKSSSLRYWATFVEKYGMPWPIGRVPENATPAQMDNLQSDLMAMVRNAVTVIRGTGSVELLNNDAGKSASADIYEKMGHFCNSEISKAVVGQTLTTEIGPTGGAFAASKTHQEVRGDLVDRDKKMIARSMGTLMGWIVGFNLPGAPVPRFVFREEENARIDLANRDKVLYDTGVRFKKAYYVRKYGFVEAEFEVMDPATPAPVPFGTLPPGNQPENQPPEDPAQDEAAPPETGGTRTAEDPDDGDGEFAEKEDGLDALAAETADAAAPAMERMVRTLIEQARATDSPEELRSRMHGIYTAMDEGQLVEIMARGGFTAAAQGFGEAEQKLTRMAGHAGR